jgi:hypothetical protein
VLRGNVRGMDAELDPTANPESDPKKQSHQRIDLFLGVNFFVPRGKLKGNRLTLEGGFPIYQYLGGPQIETDWQITLGWSYTFHQ